MNLNGDLKSNIFLKLGVIGGLILLLLIPAMMVKDLILDRENVQNGAIREVSSKWGNGQKISGPYISIPYDRYEKRFNKKDSTTEIIKLKDWIHILPENLKINGSISPQKRYRGIFEVVLYESEFSIDGNFPKFELEKLDIDKSNIRFEKASLNIGISDLKGIEKQVVLNLNGEEISFNSGTTSNQVTSSGINAGIPLSSDSLQGFSFSTVINLKGSQHLYFIPVGKTTDVTMSSNWTTPSFTGTYLPDERKVDESGFVANWNILHLNRNYPQMWNGSSYDIDGSYFGTDLLLPVDNYKKSYRVAKYAILFLVLTFATFFFVEILKKVFIHPIQYLLIGLALIIFYALLVSFSEHIGFDYSYLLSAVLTLLLISFYTYSILKSKQLGLLISGILAILYTFIFSIIQLRDYALLMGSIGMFIILALVMYFSRKVDWGNIRPQDEK
jgi:inner membrane protein